ncbi:TM2 domain-containing protein [Stenotrophomonas maltophilia]|uniref:TM2 domain-containing protein n=1 Tax=Stenotrophomonas maltophilia TaxID=40324 RepID=UPI0015DFF696|nr:TM2 domain-containing protein [Stenotrophomonas maltophilia]
MDLSASPLDIGRPEPDADKLPASSRSMYIVLALLFGPLGFHDFYVGKVGLGALKLAVMAIILFVQPIAFAAVFLLLYLIAVVQAFAVRHDSQGRPLA